MMEFSSVSDDVIMGPGVSVSCFCNLYGCAIGDHTKIGSFVEIQKGAVIGKNCKISSHSFICKGVCIEDDVFVGHNVTFINDPYPRATNADGSMQIEKDWIVVPSLVRRGASIGSGATILCGVTIGMGSIVGAGSVVIKDIPANEIWTGNPAKPIRKVDDR
jgi:acetyltransferase-like isoleucine patch superfamily enzyme